MLAYAADNSNNPVQELYVINNTFVNDRVAGGTFVRIGNGTTTAIIQNNLFVGSGTMISGPATSMSNLMGDSASLVNRAAYDYRLTAGAAAIDSGTDPGMTPDRSMALTPTWQYVHPANAETRTVRGHAIDVGAYEYGVGATDPDAGTVGPDGGKPVSDGSTGSRDVGSTSGDADPDAPNSSGGGCGCSTEERAMRTASIRQVIESIATVLALTFLLSRTLARRTR